MSRIFISYRRVDSAESSGRIYDRLEPKYGRANVFKDVDTIPLGADFRRVLSDEVAKCNVMLVVIGQQWLSITNDHEQRRLDDPDDFVRIEVEAALARDIPVIPVLVQSAQIPHSDDLPPSLAPLSYRNGFAVRGDPYFHSDMNLLIGRLDSLFDEERPTPQVPPAMEQIAPIPVPQGDLIGSISLEPNEFPDSLRQLGFMPRARGEIVFIYPPWQPVPAGAFLMGSDASVDPNAYSEEMPQQRLFLEAFDIGRYPVTVAEYRWFIRAGHGEPSNWSQQIHYLDLPVRSISWDDARAYANWLAGLTRENIRLPTEAEWEKAARGADGSIYPWGNYFDASRCNTVKSLGRRRAEPVGSYLNGASPFGVQDAVGKIWEWTSSLPYPYPYSASDGREDPASRGPRVQRGGTDDAEARDARVARRGSGRGRGDTFGFRLARSVPKS